MRVAAYLILIALLFAPAPAPSAERDIAADIDAVVAQYHGFGSFNGAALVSKAGEVIFKKPYGMANHEWGIANTTDTRFRIASITKQFTAAVVLQLVDEGKIGLQATLDQYVPEYPKEIAQKVSIHHLLTHTSGIMSYTSLPKFRDEISRDPYSPTGFLSVLAGEKLDFEPGERFLYSNSGYFLLGLIVEKVTGQPYETVVRERIFQPLGMRGSGYDLHEPLIEKRASGYEPTLDGYKNAPYLDMSLPYAAGSLYSTVEDLYLWDRALAGGKVLSPAMSAKMFTPYEDMGVPGVNVKYGYGWIFEEAENPAKPAEKLELIGHGGGINGFNTLIQRIPSDDHLIVLLNNSPGANLNEIAANIRKILYGAEPTPAKKPLARDLLRSYNEGGQKAVEARFQKLKQSAKDEYDFGPRQFFQLADYFRDRGELDQELAVLRFAAREHPDNADAFSTLGDALAKQGNNDEAVKSYAQALEKNPKLAPRIADRLKDLEKKPQSEKP